LTLSDPTGSPSTPALLWTLPNGTATGRILLAHGAGAGQDSPFLQRLAEALAEAGLAVARFEFAYMAARRTGGKKRPPPKADNLVPEYHAAIAAFLAAEGPEGPALIAGKSMGGRVAVMAAETPLPEAIAGVVAFGYPFHPQGFSGEDRSLWRLPALVAARLPVLLCQGERDEFGAAHEMEGLDLPDHVSIQWIEDGSHDFGPRGQSPATLKSNLIAAAGHAAAFLTGLTQSSDGGATS
jgi:predicted alpha/beta-hydrolase family hydrolase